MSIYGFFPKWQIHFILFFQFFSRLRKIELFSVFSVCTNRKHFANYKFSLLFHSVYSFCSRDGKFRRTVNLCVKFVKPLELWDLTRSPDIRNRRNFSIGMNFRCFLSSSKLVIWFRLQLFRFIYDLCKLNE